MLKSNNTGYINMISQKFIFNSEVKNQTYIWKYNTTWKATGQK